MMQIQKNKVLIKSRKAKTLGREKINTTTMAIKKSGTGVPEMTVKFNLNKVSLVLEMYVGVGEISPTPAKMAILLSNSYI